MILNITFVNTTHNVQWCCSTYVFTIAVKVRSQGGWIFLLPTVLPINPRITLLHSYTHAAKHPFPAALPYKQPFPAALQMSGNYQPDDLLDLGIVHVTAMPNALGNHKVIFICPFPSRCQLCRSHGVFTVAIQLWRAFVHLQWIFFSHFQKHSLKRQTFEF